ncbi:tetratricopeptide repeat protein [Mesorhizobium sp. LHD-90]|uniref:tetratricopeptide repeat protein n=1 Tax=Mesorhizobium sp. LHD-90 TaxID=3071414 RepID=UPI0027E10488|nr:tetratricopeptide repeat protein [Mesorhizobium sp. LHD-90]MDQ6437348.1 tetratricopeptide repeat protein [Mesorhizobium sp. LHD-90]
MASGETLTGASAAAAALFEQAQHELRCFAGDPAGSIEAALADSPDFAMAHAFKGWLYGLSTEKAAIPVAKTCAGASARLAGTERERAHAEALGLLAAGGWHAAGRRLAAHTAGQPLDALALQAGHQIDFFTGNAKMLRDRIAAAMPAWSEEMPGYHAILGMQAFGLEENADYAAAERLGRRAIDLEPHDGWAQHAVAHVMEMQCRQRDGILWMRGNEAGWTDRSFLQIHNWWHLSLFHYELGEIDQVLALFDGPIYGGRPALALNLLDASAILWRLSLGRVDVGDRWTPLAESWLPKARDGAYAFNDMHAMMAFVGAGFDDAARDLLAAQDEAMTGGGDNAAFTKKVGRPVTLGMKAFGERRYADAVEALRPLPAIAHLFGGSHAQRDVIALTLIEAALRADDGFLARDLTAKRLAARPASPLSALLAKRAGALPPAG